MLKDIPVSELTPGMFVECYGDGSFNNPFHNLRDFIRSREQIEELKAQGVDQVTVDTEKTRPGSGPGAAARGTQPPSKGPEVGGRLYAHCLGHVMEVMSKVRKGLDADFVQSFEAVDILLSGVEEDPARMMLLAKLYHYDDYTLRHSLNVSLLSLIFGKHLGLGQDELRRLGFAGLYHDLGKFKIPLEILNKPAKLSDREFEVMKLHSRLGYELLREHEGIGEDILLGVLHHHERFDGRGYPDMLKAGEKNPFARILTIVDIFDALTTDRPYKRASTPHEALKAMFAWRNETFHPGMLEKFVECFGVYPPGSLVRLTDQTYGIVVEARPSHPARPLVKVCFSRKLRAQPPVLVDLSETPKACDGGLDIEACVDPKSMDIVLERFI